MKDRVRRMKTFFKGLLLFCMVLIGIGGVITVDMRSGEMAGYPPTMEFYVKDAVVEEKTEGFARGFELTFIVNNKDVAKKLVEIENAMGRI